MRVSYYYFLAGVRPASHPPTVSIFAFIVRSIWAIGHVLEIHLHFVVNNCEFFIIHNNSKNILTGFPVFIHFCLLLLYCLIHRCQLCCLVCAAQLALWFLRLTAEAEALIADVARLADGVFPVLASLLSLSGATASAAMVTPLSALAGGLFLILNALHVYEYRRNLLR